MCIIICMNVVCTLSPPQVGTLDPVADFRSLVAKNDSDVFDRGTDIHVYSIMDYSKAL